jgi:hypothetical protein
MAIKSNTLFGNGRDDDRISGFKKVDLSVTTEYNNGFDELIGGMVVCSDGSVDASGKTIHLFNGQTALSAVNGLPLGLVYENTKPYPATTSGDNAAGVGHDSLDYARGGIYSAFHRPGNFVDVFDDFRNTAQIGSPAQNFSCPFVATDTFAVGSSVYATPQGSSYGMGRLTTDPTSATAIIGTVRANNGLSGNLQQFTIELGIRGL